MKTCSIFNEERTLKQTYKTTNERDAINKQHQTDNIVSLIKDWVEQLALRFLRPIVGLHKETRRTTVPVKVEWTVVSLCLFELFLP